VLSGGGKVAVSACCALVIAGGAVTVPVVAEHHHTLPAAVEGATAPLPEITLPAPRPTRRETLPHGPARPTPVATTVPVTAPPRRVAANKPKPVARVSSREWRRVQLFLRVFIHNHPSDAERAEMSALLRNYAKQPVGSRARKVALRKVQAAVFRPKQPVLPAPTPTPTATPTPTPTTATAIG
jgi:hypothetical protein